MSEQLNHWEIRGEVSKALVDDLLKIENALEQSDDQTIRRNYVRALFAYYEFTLSNLRESVANIIQLKFQQGNNLILADIIPLLDNSHNLTDKGTVRLEPNKISFINLIRYTIGKYCKEIGLEENFFGDTGWDFFKKSVQVRHKITHPKWDIGIDINDSQLEFCIKGKEWWNNSLASIREFRINNPFAWEN